MRVRRRCGWASRVSARQPKGWSAWVSGDGALQSICLEELERLGESLPLQRLLDRLNQSMVPPRFWAELRADMVGAIKPLPSLQLGADQGSGGVGQAHGQGADDQVA